MLRIEGISKTYQFKPLLEDINLSVNRGEILCLLGPSGSGKSTLLRIIAGLEKPESGRLFWDDADIMDLQAYERNFGFMFQDYALFPHMSVRENVAFGLEMKGLARELIDKRVREVLKMVEMADFLERNVTDLSGGEKQRVALARAIAPKPQLLMLDEPLGSLDRTLRDQLIMELGSVLQQLETPVIYVTHDQEEAFSIGDRLAVLHNASIIQSGTPEDVYSHPASLWLAGFLGFNNQLPGTVISEKPLRVKTPIGVFRPGDPKDFIRPGDKVSLVFKPDGLIDFLGGTMENCFDAEVKDCLFFGDRYKLVVVIETGQEFTFFREDQIERLEKVQMSVCPESILCYKMAHG